MRIEVFGGCMFKKFCPIHVRRKLTILAGSRYEPNVLEQYLPWYRHDYSGVLVFAAGAVCC